MMLKDPAMYEEYKKAAREVFIKNGYIATKMVDISEKVGRSVCNIYTYYPSKEELFNAVVEPAKRDKESAEKYPLEFAMIIEKEGGIAKLLQRLENLSILV
jgi:AcrR family transcriptional regulator